MRIPQTCLSGKGVNEATLLTIARHETSEFEPKWRNAFALASWMQRATSYDTTSPEDMKEEAKTDFGG